jgi:hypothetical protein
MECAGGTAAAPALPTSPHVVVVGASTLQQLEDRLVSLLRTLAAKQERLQRDAAQTLRTDVASADALSSLEERLLPAVQAISSKQDRLHAALHEQASATHALRQDVSHLQAAVTGKETMFSPLNRASSALSRTPSPGAYSDGCPPVPGGYGGGFGGGSSSGSYGGGGGACSSALDGECRLGEESRLSEVRWSESWRSSERVDEDSVRSFASRRPSGTTPSISSRLQRTRSGLSSAPPDPAALSWQAVEADPDMSHLVRPHAAACARLHLPPPCAPGHELVLTLACTLALMAEARAARHA